MFSAAGSDDQDFHVSLRASAITFGSEQNQTKIKLPKAEFVPIMMDLEGDTMRKSFLVSSFIVLTTLFLGLNSFAQPAPSATPPAAELAPAPAVPAPSPAPPTPLPAAPSIDANAIVAKADAVRVPKGSYEFDTVVTSYEGEEKKSENGYKAYVKDLEHSLVVFSSPASERGKSLLMLGDDLWIYLPNVKKPVRIPLQQRLVGDVSNGDMTRINFAVDYNATAAGEANVNGTDCWVLDLTAKTDNKTYNKIKYWVAKADNKPVKAEYFTVSGQSLKTCTFEDFRMEAGAVRPMKLIFQDSVTTNKKSTLVLSNMITKSLGDNMFTKDYMKTFE
jgi:outer membrane lipoprotein-sorting protein